MRRLLLPAFLMFAAACGPGADADHPNRTTTADNWFKRAKASYRSGDIDDASTSIDGALKASPKDDESRLLAARVALARLDYAAAIKVTEGLLGTDAKSLRGRAFWYAGDLEHAADELEDMLKDPNVKDPWARDVAKLARRGQGRHPFALEGSVVAAVEMPPAGPAMVVPCELEGERILALVDTAMGELMIDSSSRKEPAWVNLKFTDAKGQSVEVKDVPALTFDLSAISRQLGATIKALIGVNTLRHMHATFDRRGSQFVVRKNDPPAPPEGSRVPVFYVRGGGMMMRAAVNQKEDGAAPLFVDSSAFYPLALDEPMLKRAGADLTKFQANPGIPPTWKVGEIPFFRLGPLDLPRLPTIHGAPLADYKEKFDVDLGGVVGAGLLQAFRVTFAEDGRFLWMEIDPTVFEPGPQVPAQAGPNSAPPPPPPAPKQGPQLTPPSMKSTPSPGPGAAPAPPLSPNAPKSENKGPAK